MVRQFPRDAKRPRGLAAILNAGRSIPSNSLKTMIQENSSKQWEAALHRKGLEIQRKDVSRAGQEMSIYDNSVSSKPTLLTSHVENVMDAPQMDPVAEIEMRPEEANM